MDVDLAPRGQQRSIALQQRHRLRVGESKSYVPPDPDMPQFGQEDKLLELSRKFHSRAIELAPFGVAHTEAEQLVERRPICTSKDVPFDRTAQGDVPDRPG